MFKNPVCYKKQALALLVLCLNFFPSIGMCGDDIFIYSSPTGADAYVKESRTLQYIGSTPTKFNTTFRSNNHSKKIYLRKLGYEHAHLLIAADSKSESIKLEKKAIFYSPEKHKSEKLKKIQKAINQKISNLIYSKNNLFKKTPFEILGQITVLENKGKYSLNMDVLLDDSFRREHLRQISRMRNKQERHRKLIDSVLEKRLVNFLFSIHKSMKNIKDLDTIYFGVNYLNKKFTLSEENSSYKMIRYGFIKDTSGYTYSGGSVTNVSHSKTVFDENKDLSLLSFKMRPFLENDINKEAFLLNIKNNSEIRTNDNKKRVFERVSY